MKILEVQADLGTGNKIYLRVKALNDAGKLVIGVRTCEGREFVAREIDRLIADLTTTQTHVANQEPLPF